MSDTVTNLAGNAEPRTAAAAGFQNARVPLSELFADVLDKTAFADRMFSQSDFGLTRAEERDYELRQDIYNTDRDRTDAEPPDDTTAEVRDSDDQSDGDDQSRDSAEAETETQAEEQPQVDDVLESPEVLAAALESSPLATGAAAHETQKPGLTVDPNFASGVELQSMAASLTAGQSRVIITRGEIQAGAHTTANTANAFGQDTAMQANSALAKIQSGANGQQPDAATLKSGPKVDGATTNSGLNANAAAAKTGPNVDAAAADKPQTKDGPVLPQAQAAVKGDAEGLGTPLERHTLLVRAGAKRAAELHNMKVRLSAHRDAIKKAISQSSARSNGAQPQSATSNAGKPSIEITTSATPPAPAAYDGPAARPATLFNLPTFGTLPGQAGVNGSSNLAIGETVGNGSEQSTVAADRQTMTSNSLRGLGLRPTPAQPAYQPAEQVKVHIQQLAKSGADRIQIKLSPASLGRVEVTLEVSPDKAVQAIVYVEKPETLDMLERDARVLQQALEEAGMKLDSDGLMFKHGQSGNADAEFADSTEQTENGGALDGEDSDAGETATNDQPSRRRHDGMLDLEI